MTQEEVAMGKSADEKLECYMTAVRRGLVNAVRGADVRTQLDQTIEAIWNKDKARAYLAIRGYLRFPPSGKGGTLEDHWVWTEAQARQYLNGTYFRTVVQPLLDRVSQEFVTLNPSFRRTGAYSLRANTHPRSLREQRNNWLKFYDPANDDTPNKITGIERIHFVAQDLKAKLLAEIAEAGYGDDPTPGTLATFKKFLTGRRTNPRGKYAPLTYATPGLSAHGQARAFDFVVMLGGRTVAGTEGDPKSLKKKWRNDKWDEQLNTAVRVVDPDGSVFDGPLKSPDEPWHYYYTPTPPVESD
jgi:hypothetical protein